MQHNIQEQVKDALRAKDQVRLITLRGVLASFTNELVAKGRKPNENLTDDEALAVVKRLVKQRKDSIEQFEKGNRQDLAETEKAELEILEEFLPAQMSEADIRKVVMRKLDELKQTGSTSSPQVGQFMGAVMKEFGGNAEGTMVKRIVEELLG